MHPSVAHLHGGSVSPHPPPPPAPKAIKKANINEEDIGGGEPAPKLEGLSASKKIVEKGKNAKIFIISSSTILSDQLIDSEGVTTNATFVLNIIDHLNDNTKIAVMRSKQQSFNPLKETTPFNRNFTKLLNIAILPCLVILFGFVVLFKRSLRKKQIKLAFTKQ